MQSAIKRSVGISTRAFSSKARNVVVVDGTRIPFVLSSKRECVLLKLLIL